MVVHICLNFSVRSVLFSTAFPSFLDEEEKLCALVAVGASKEKVWRESEWRGDMLLTLRHVLEELLLNRKQIDKSQKQQQKRTAKQIEEIKRMVKWWACKCE